MVKVRCGHLIDGFGSVRANVRVRFLNDNIVRIRKLMLRLGMGKICLRRSFSCWPKILDASITLFSYLGGQGLGIYTSDFNSFEAKCFP